MIETRALLKASANVEIATGLALLSAPRGVVRLLLDADLDGPGVVASRVCGLGLLFLGLCCRPRRGAPERPASKRAVRTLLGYNALAGTGLAGLAATGRYAGVALMPAIIMHGLFAGLFATRARTS